MATKLETVGKVLDNLPQDTLHSAMARAFADIEAATKDAVNPHFKNKYADLSRVIEAVKPALVQNGLFFTQRCHPAENGVSVETVLHHKSGEDMSLGTLFVPADKQNPQGFGSALTYAKRYALQTAFGVPTEDDDGNAGSKDRGSANGKSAAITDAQLAELLVLADKAGVSAADICAVYKIPDLPHLPAEKFERAKASLHRKLEPVNA